MFFFSKCLLFLATTAIGINFLSASARALVSVTPLPRLTDDEFNNLIRTGQFSELFVTESRIGNNATNGTQEISVQDPRNSLLPVTQGQRQWTSDQPVNFRLEYTGSTVNYTVGDQLLSSNAFSGSASDIFLRTRAENNSRLNLMNLLLNGQSLPSLMSSGANISDIDYLRLGNLPSSFTLTGDSTFSWLGEPPRNSQLAYQIKVGNSASRSVPEPAKLAGLLLIGILGIGFGKRQKEIVKP
ncbi:MAG: PEP-CTERM sorting domain-containing protein [Calothrix sp. SM1_7_51]|nr:PEP-CTERM sorting domain-containing protein [Calothrix sp. SM1_7_51]